MSTLRSFRDYGVAVRDKEGVVPFLNGISSAHFGVYGTIYFYNNIEDQKS